MLIVFCVRKVCPVMKFTGALRLGERYRRLVSECFQYQTSQGSRKVRKTICIKSNPIKIEKYDPFSLSIHDQLHQFVKFDTKNCFKRASLKFQFNNHYLTQPCVVNHIPNEKGTRSKTITSLSSHANGNLQLLLVKCC